MAEVSLCWRAAEKERLSCHFVGAVSSQLRLSFGATARREPCPLAGLPSRFGIVIPHCVCPVGALGTALPEVAVGVSQVVAAIAFPFSSSSPCPASLPFSLLSSCFEGHLQLLHEADMLIQMLAVLLWTCERGPSERACSECSGALQAKIEAKRFVCSLVPPSLWELKELRSLASSCRCTSTAPASERRL